MDTRNLRSPADRLIWAIMELVDRNVDVHAWDGSVFSGIFYTACFEKEHCIVLKNARMTRKGKSSANVTEEVPISILIIQTDDFVQVVVKKDELPSKGTAGNVAGNDVEAAADTIASSEFTVTPVQKEEQINQTRQTGDDISQREHDGYSKEIVDGIEEGSCLQLNSSGAQVTPVAERHASGVSPSSSSAVDVTLDMSFHLVPPQGSVLNKSTQESKLNPEAQNFAPSFTKPEAEIPARQANADMASMPNYHVAPAASQPEVGVGPYAYQYPVPGNGGPQFSQHVIRHMGSGIQPVRFASQYSPAHAGPPYVHPNSPNVMAAPYEYPLQNLVGQHPYMQQHPYVQHPYLQHPYAQYPYAQHPYVQHPYGNVISYDVVHGTAGIPPVPARPQVNPYQVQYPKSQGNVAAGQALQLCMPPSFLTGGQQRISVPSHFSLLQSRFSTTRRIPIPGSNGLFGTKLS